MPGNLIFYVFYYLNEIWQQISFPCNHASPLYTQKIVWLEFQLPFPRMKRLFFCLNLLGVCDAVDVACKLFGKTDTHTHVCSRDTYQVHSSI